MTDAITWTPTTVLLSALKPWPRNPKTISREAAERLLKNWQELGQFQTIAIGPQGQVYDGHQRLNVLKAAYGLAYRVTALQSSRELTEQERERLTIEAHVGAVGQFDWDALAAWDTDALQGWGMDADALTQWRGDVAALGHMLVVGIDDEEAFGALPDEDRAPFQQMTFTLHDSQAEQVREALKLAKTVGGFFDSENENSNGNALARICETYMTEHGNG